MSGGAILSLDGISKQFGKTVTANDIHLDFARGEFFTLLGPSGSGKSTILRIIAGLEEPDSGRILLDGEDVTDTPPWRRRIGMVFQSYANFPHMDVAANVAYGLRRLAMGREDREARVVELLRLVGLEGFDRRPVTQLSGGEQQRVAVARALAPRPKILLLDEPLSALDEKIRREMQEELRRIQQTTAMTFIYVTHDQEEALTMSDRVAVLNRGTCVQCDAPETIFRRPRTRFIAQFFRGCNVLDGEYELAGGRSRLRIGSARAQMSMPGFLPGPIGVAIRGEDVHLGADAEGRGLILKARVAGRVYRGLYTDYRLVFEDGQSLSAMTSRELEVAVGDEVTVGIDAAAVVPLHEA